MTLLFFVILFFLYGLWIIRTLNRNSYWLAANINCPTTTSTQICKVHQSCVSVLVQNTYRISSSPRWGNPPSSGPPSRPHPPHRQIPGTAARGTLASEWTPLWESELQRTGREGWAWGDTDNENMGWKMRAGIERLKIEGAKRAFETEKTCRDRKIWCEFCRKDSPLAPLSTKPKPSLSFFCRSTVFSLMM